MVERRFGEKLAAYDALKAWPRAAGEEISKRSVALGIKSGILYVSVSTNVWLTQLTILKDKLIARINQELGRKVVKDIRFSRKGVRRHKRNG